MNMNSVLLVEDVDEYGPKQSVAYCSWLQYVGGSRKIHMLFTYLYPLVDRRCIWYIRTMVFS
jgi:hypothetical protein